MIYLKILNPKHKKLFRGLAIMTLLLFSLTINACYTYKTEYYSPEELRTKDDYSVQKVILKNDSIVNLENYDVMYVHNTDSSKNVLLCEYYSERNSIGLTPQAELKIKKSTYEIKLDKILKAKVETKKLDLMKTFAFISAGLVLLIVSLIYFISEVDCIGCF